MRVGSGGANVGARHASDRDAGGEVVEQVALQALRRLVVGMMMVVVVRGQHRRVMKVPRRRRGRAGHARHACHGVVGGIWLERMTLLSDDVHRRQRLGSLEQGLIKASKDVTLQLYDREQV